ncbi:MAG: serine hydrolase [Oscillospiraceae bacterium]|nr:serine hydrolase [Oscillospiraceae bacterium]
MKKAARFISLVICLVMVLPLAPQAFADSDLLYPVTVTVSIGDGKEYIVRGYDVTHENNLYLSLNDLAAVLKTTEKKFTVQFQNSSLHGAHFVINTGKASGTAPFTGKDSRSAVWAELLRNRIFFNGSDMRYYTYASNGALYMSLIDIRLMLDLSVEAFPDNALRIYPDQTFTVDMVQLKEEGYFDAFSSVLVGDANRNTVLFAQNSTFPVPIASTSKLMTYLLLREAMDGGSVKSGDIVKISKNAAELSLTADAMVKLGEGTSVPLDELVRMMLLASSNECALAIAEHVSGSEEKFVELMNGRAAELGLRTARFYNSNGLPVFGETGLPSKLQNRMSASDMFRLCSYILEHYPDITDITSLQYSNMPTLNYTTANSNPLVFNMPGTTGLKTGSTTKAGYCLVASCKATVDGEEHTLVAVVFGAETPGERGQAAEILLRFAKGWLS